MKLCSLGCALAALAIGCSFRLSTSHADVVVSSFEEPSLAASLNPDRAFEGLTETASQFRSGAVTFNNDGVFFGGSSWSGFGYSQRTAPGAGQFLYDSSNDLIAKPGIGAGGSATWAIATAGGIMTADAGYLFDTLTVTNTLYSWDSMVNGDPFAGPPLGKGSGTGRFAGQDDFFTVRFTNTSNSAFLDFNLADFRGVNAYIHDAWQALDLSSLAASQISISFLGSRETNFIPPPDPPFYFLDTPALVALDNISVRSITAVPEPSSWLLVSAVSILTVRWRKQSRGKRVTPPV